MYHKSTPSQAAFSKISHRFAALLSVALIAAAVTFLACGTSSDGSPTELDPEDQVLVINEVMASNRTGIMAEDGQLYDWIEVKNISDRSVALEDYSLTFEKKTKKNKKDKKGKKDEKKEKTDKKEKGEKGASDKKEWKFPKTELAPGAVVVVYASKRNIAQPGKAMHASFKISSKGGVLRVMKGSGVVSELKYGKVNGDQCICRTQKGKYEKSYMQTPGFENNDDGFEAYNAIIAKQRRSPLLIWEAHSKGASSRVLKENDGWIEVKNVSDQTVQLSEYSITTKQDNLVKWSLPEKKLEPGDVYVVQRNRAKFNIGSSETILLLKGDKFVDGVCTKPAPYGVSVGRKNGKEGFFFFRETSRGKENSGQPRRFIAEAPTFTVKPGVYAGKKSVAVKLNTHGCKVHYTTDGSAPGLKSKVYKDSIVVTENTVIRAFAEGDDDHIRSESTAGTYLLDREHKMAVMSISCNPGEMFDSRSGIYVAGPNAGKEHPHKGANYWKNTTIRAHVEFFDGKKGFSLNCGLAIFGGFSRAEPKKSFKLKFKDNYGPDELNYDVFGRGKKVKLKNMVLRSGSQDIYGVMVRDEFFTSLMHEECPELLVQDYRPMALYINGEYFGLYYIREKVDKHFVARHLGVSKDSVRIVMAGKYHEEGPEKEWKALMSYLKNKDMKTAESYKWVCDHLDVLAIADQNIAQIYTRNTDMGNVRYVYSPDSIGDRKWHVIYYDADATWNASPPVAYYIRTSGVEDGTFNGSNNIIINALLKNKDFRALYLERVSHHLHKTFAPNHVTPFFDAIINTIRPEMPYNGKRWPKVLPMEKWENNVTKFRSKFADRPKMLLDGLRKELKITPAEEKKYFSDLGY